MLLMILSHIIYEMSNFLIRKAIADDAYWIAYVNAHTRYTTYKWLMPEKLLQTRINTIEERAAEVRDSILEGKEYLVVENLDTKDIVWMSIYWNSRNDKYPDSWEIYAIYVLKDYQKLWLGKRLFFAGIECLIEKWYNDMIINVLDWNPTIDFYKKYGGFIVWEWTFQVGKVLMKEKIIFFENIPDILKM